METLPSAEFIDMFTSLETKCCQWKDDARAQLEFESGEMREWYAKAVTTLTKFRFEHSTELAQEMCDTLALPDYRDYISANYNTGFFRSRMNEVVLDIIRDFKRIHLLRLSNVEKKLFETKLPFGNRAALKFPEVQQDAIEAARCYAVGRYTGVVFHLMRVMELLTQRFAARLGVAPVVKGKPILIEDASWDMLLRGVNRHIEDEFKKGLSQMEKKNILKYREVYVYLDHIRAVWRNPVAHPHIFINQLEAKNILNLVRQYVIVLIDVL